MDTSTHLRTAEFWQALDDRRVECGLCAHRCRLAAGQHGRCRVRWNDNGSLKTLTYGRLCAAAADPIEKKPLFHFQPGSRSFSVATQGCNFQCDFCQNWQISQGPRQNQKVDGKDTRADQVVQAALRNDCTSIAYTYSEPTIFMEWAADCGRLACEKGLANVFVSNGYLTPEAVTSVQSWLQGINIDLKAFSDDFYRRHCQASLKPVLETIRRIARETGIWLEVTTLLIPEANDGEDELKHLASWLAEEAGPQVPWHISRFFPQYQSEATESTSVDRLQTAYEIGRAAGLHYVYLGNVPGSQTESSFCHQCGHLLIERVGYTIRGNHLKQGACPECCTPMAGWGLSSDG